MRANFITCISMIVCFAVVSVCFLPFSSFAQQSDNSDHTQKLEAIVRGSGFEFSHEVSREVWSGIEAKTGADDIYKTYMYVGDCESSYSSGTQYFTNGRYEKGVFVCDEERLSHWISTALSVYSDMENLLTDKERCRARSVISYAYEKLSVTGRMKVKSSPEWLVGGFYDGYKPTCYADGMRISTSGQLAPRVFTDEIRKIRIDGEGYSFGICFDAVGTSSFEIELSGDAEYFTAVLGSDISALEADYENAYLKASLAYDSGKIRDAGSFFIFKGCENKVEIELEGAHRLRFEIFCSTQTDSVICLLADPMLLSLKGESLDGMEIGECSRDKFADIDRDGIVSSSDIKMLKYAASGNSSFKKEHCDLSKNGVLDYFDVICLENYLIYLENRSNEYRKPGVSLKLTALGDSIARGCGLEGADNGECSNLAYNNLVSDMLEDIIGYDAELESFAKDGERSADLLSRLKLSSEMKQSVRESDLVLVSIGGNDFLQTLWGLLSLAGSSFDQSQLSELAIVKDGKVVLNEALKEYVDLAAADFGKSLSEVLEELKGLNPDAVIVITEIPNSAPSASVCLRIENSLGSYKRELWDLHAFMDSVLEPFNNAVREECSGFSNAVSVELAHAFDGSPELSLAVVEKDIFINELLAGDLSAFTRFDVHPSEKGHLEMAKEHINVLEGLPVLEKWIAEYEQAQPEQKPYRYSESFGKEELALSSGISLDEGSCVVYKATVSQASSLENLLAQVSFDGERLSFVSVKLEGIDTNIYSVADNEIRIVADKESIIGENAVITLIFKRLNEGSENAQFSFTATESRLTYAGEWKAQSSVVDKVDLDSLEKAGDPADFDEVGARKVVYAVFAVVFVLVVFSAIAAVAAKRKKKP